MSTPLINRSLTTIRTELEFLLDSEVITNELYDKIVGALPQKYKQGDTAVGADKLGGSTNRDSSNNNHNNNNNNNGDKLANELNNVHISAPSVPPPSAAPREPIGYCKVLYDYNAQEREDLQLRKNDKVVVVEHLSSDWWKGYRRNEDPQSAGVFPANYITTISKEEFDAKSDRPAVAVGEKQSYNSSQSNLPQQEYNPYPPPAQNYYPPQQMQQQPPPQQYVVQQEVQQQPQSSGHNHLKKFGSKLGNAAIFGAGATIGSDIVNSIF